LVAALSRTREFAADLGAARLTGDPGALADALETIEYRPRTWLDWLMGRRFPVRGEPASDLFRSHPPTPERIRRLALMAVGAS
jgi:heat shock protein HtpX